LAGEAEKEEKKIRRAQRIRKQRTKPFSCLEESEGIVGREGEGRRKKEGRVKE
jgi:hypothetical protein